MEAELSLERAFHRPVRLPRPTTRVYASVAAAVLGVGAVVMQVRLTGHALADIVGALGSSPDEAAWINTVHAVAELLTIPVAGWLSARISARRVFVPAALAFSTFSLAATLVTNVDQLIVLRALQGLTGGAFIPMATPLFRRKLPYRHRLVAFALYGVAASVPISLAPLIESYFVDDSSWRLLFVPPAVLSALAAALASWGMPVVPFDRRARWNPDWAGTLSLPMALAFVVLGVDQANRLDWLESRWVVGMIVAGLSMLLFYVVHERSHPRPYFPLDLWTNRSFAIGVLSFLTFTGSLIAIVWALPDFLQRVEGFRPSDFADVFGAMILPQLVLPFLVVRLSHRLDLRLVLAAGIACQALACLRLATLDNDWAAPELVPIFALHGIGQALFYTPVLVLLTMRLDDAHRDGAVSIVNLTRVFANTVGVSVASTYLTQTEHLHHAMLNERLRMDGGIAEERMQSVGVAVVEHVGGDEGGRRALELAARALRGEAFVLAYGDLFLAIGACLLCVLVAQAFMDPITLDELRPRPSHGRRIRRGSAE